MAKTEETKAWEDLSDKESFLVVLVHSTNLQIKQALMKRLFELGRPKVVFVSKGGRYAQCRIHPDSVDVMKVIIREYGQTSNL